MNYALTLKTIAIEARKSMLDRDQREVYDDLLDSCMEAALSGEVKLEIAWVDKEIQELVKLERINIENKSDYLLLWWNR